MKCVNCIHPITHVQEQYIREASLFRNAGSYRYRGSCWELDGYSSGSQFPTQCVETRVTPRANQELRSHILQESRSHTSQHEATEASDMSRQHPETRAL